MGFDLQRKARLLIKQCIMELLGNKVNLISDEQYNALIYRVIFGKWPNLKAPQTFNENILYRKIYLDQEDLWIYTDKFEVRKYVEKTIGTDYLNELLGIYDSFNQIDFNELPDSFALKCTHGSGYNSVVIDKQTLNIAKERALFTHWLSENYYYKGREKNYRKITPRILCDAYIQMPTSEGLPEVKIFCFNGTARFFAYNIVKAGKTRCNIYMADHQYIDVKRGYGNCNDIDLPANIDEFLAVAEKLAVPFPFVRVDLYNIDGKIIFSELTFHSGGGFVPFSPTHFDKDFGIYFNELEKPV